MADNFQTRHSTPDWQVSSTSEEPDDQVPDGSDDAGDEDDLSEKYNEFKRIKIETPRLFHDTEEVAKSLQSTMVSLADEIALINQKENEDKAKGSALSFAGGLMGIAGTLFAPVTFGGSLVLTTTGVAMSLGGGVISSKAENRMTIQTNEKIGKSKTLSIVFNNRMNEWKKIAEILDDTVKMVRGLFSVLEEGFGNMLGVIEDCKHKEKSSDMVKCFFKCVSNFYGVTQTSTHVVLNAEKIARLAIRVKAVKYILLAGKNVGDAAKIATGVASKAALDKPNVVLSVSKQVLTTAGHAVAIVKQSETASKVAKIVSCGADGSGKVVKTKTAVKLFSNTVTKETATVTATVSKIGLGFGVILAAVDFYQLGSAIKASKSTCDAEKKLQSCIQNITKNIDQVLSQVNIYKELMRIKFFFESLLEHGRDIVFGESKLPLNRVRYCVDKINNLHDVMNKIPDEEITPFL